MPSVSTNVLTRFNSPINGIAGYYVPNEGTQHVIVGTSDTNIDTLTEVYWKSGQRVMQDVLTHFQVAMAPGGGYYDSNEGTQHVIVWTRVGDLIEVYWKSGQGVQQDTLTSFPSIGGFAGFAGYYIPNEGTQHAIIGTIDSPINTKVGIVTEIYWKSGQGVQQNVLARFNGSISVLGAFYVPEEGTQRTLVVTSEGNLTEMYWKSGQGVKQDVLLPHVGRSGTAFYSADDNTQHVVLVSADGTLTDVHWQSGQGIHQDVLTQLSAITNNLAIQGLTGYYSANDQKRHVIIATGDGALIEVYW